jgi:drug/metabolite transporter (DMT)-like permease
MSTDPARLRAVQMLILANAGWALSFPVVKALLLVQQPLVPGASSWFLSSLTVAYRFGFAALLMFVICARTLRRMTWLEFWEGLVLGLISAAGLIFQMDGLAYTSASTSAFLTQFYCLLIPLIVALRDRRWPSWIVVLSCLMVMAGVAVLSDFHWGELRIGRGELETLIASTIFTAQILWLQRAKFAGNNVDHFTFVMFAVTAIACAPVAWWTQSQPSDWVRAFDSFYALGFLAILVVFCTMGAYRLMNRWQPFLTATQAGLMYCLEPVFASLFALVLPGLFSSWAGVNYPNEKLTASLLLGGALITVANALIQMAPTRPSEVTKVSAKVPDPGAVRETGS